MLELYSKGSAYYVKTIYNGQTLKFQNCDNNDLCELDDFFEYMDTRLVLDPNGLEETCNKLATPDQFENDMVPDWHWSQSIYENRPDNSIPKQ